MNKILPIILVVVLSGCASFKWAHTSGNVSSYQYDRQNCSNRFYSQLRPASCPSCNPSALILLIQIKEVQYVEACLSNRGYYKKYE